MQINFIILFISEKTTSFAQYVYGKGLVVRALQTGEACDV